MGESSPARMPCLPALLACLAVPKSRRDCIVAVPDYLQWNAQLHCTLGCDHADESVLLCIRLPIWQSVIVHQLCRLFTTLPESSDGNRCSSVEHSTVT